MKKQTLHTLQALKTNGEPIAMLTAYDASFAKLLNQAAVDAILIGDSLGMVLQGHDSTIPVSLDAMCYHTGCVARGNSNSLLIADMPYMSYATTEQTLANAAKLMQAGANMVKVEGGSWLLPSIEALVERGIPVCAHLGLTPQSVDALGGFKVQGRAEGSAQRMLSEAKALESAGASLLVLECVPAKLAAEITQQLKIPTIGIGAGCQTDGQVLVLHDMLGLNLDFKPKFVKDFMSSDAQPNSVLAALKAYVAAVKNRQFPAQEHQFD